MSHMIPCPQCGSSNSELRDVCFACGARLHKQPSGLVPICRDCRHSTLFPPPPNHIGPHDIWCTLYDKPMAAEGAAPPCFEPAFGWGRKETLD